MANFFNFSSKPGALISVVAPEAGLSIIKRLGKPKFWVSNQEFNEIMEKIYHHASSAALGQYCQQKSKREENVT
ncbi:MAG: hypothetical protein AB1668_00775 [Nanoarchaeota archaeon]